VLIFGGAVALRAAGAADDGQTTHTAQVMAIDTIGRTLVIRDARGVEETVQLDDSLAGFGDIRVGDRVILTLRKGPGWSRVTSVIEGTPSARPAARPVRAPRPAAAEEALAADEVLDAKVAAAVAATIPTGTSIDLALQTGLDTRTAKVGDTFRATVVPPIHIDDLVVLPEGTVVVGKVELVRSIRHGDLTGVIGVSFTHMQLPGGSELSLSGELTSLRQDDRKRLVEFAPEVSTGRKLDTVFIGQSSDGRASTLVGDDLAKEYSESGLGQARATVAAGTQITMELAEELELPAVVRTAANRNARHIRVAKDWVAAAQQALTEKEYYEGPIDGRLGGITEATRQAIIRFQLDQRQLATGDLDAETLRLLDVKPPPRH
jgi:hypothetical protein